MSLSYDNISTAKNLTSAQKSSFSGNTNSSPSGNSSSSSQSNNSSKPSGGSPSSPSSSIQQKKQDSGRQTASYFDSLVSRGGGGGSSSKPSTSKSSSQSSFDKYVDDLQRQTGMGDYGKGGTKDVRAEATANAETRSAAQNQLFSERARAGGGLSVGGRRPDGSRITSVSGSRPTITDAEIDARQRLIVADRARQEIQRQREIERQGGPNQAAGAYTRIAQEQGIDLGLGSGARQGGYYNASAGNEILGTTIVGGPSGNSRPQPGTVEYYQQQFQQSRQAAQDRESGNAQFKVTTDASVQDFNPFKEGFYNVKRDAQGNVVGGEVLPQPDIGFGAKGAVTVEHEGDETYLHYKATEDEAKNLYGFESTYTVPQANLTQLNYEALQELSRQGGVITSDAINRQAGKLLDEKYSQTGLPVMPTEEQQRERTNVSYAAFKGSQIVDAYNKGSLSAYSLSDFDVKLLNKYDPSLQGNIIDSGAKNRQQTQAEKIQNLPAEIVQYQKDQKYNSVPHGDDFAYMTPKQNYGPKTLGLYEGFTDSSYQWVQIVPTGPNNKTGKSPEQLPEFKPDFAQQLWRSTVGFGGGIAKGALDLAGLGETRLYGAITGDWAGADKYLEQGLEGTQKIKDFTGLNTLADIYGGIGKATGNKSYLAEADFTRQQASVQKDVIDPLMAASGGLAAGFGSKEGSDILAGFFEQTKNRPVETIITTGIDFALFGGPGLIKGFFASKAPRFEPISSRFPEQLGVSSKPLAEPASTFEFGGETVKSPKPVWDWSVRQNFSDIIPGEAGKGLEAIPHWVQSAPNPVQGGVLDAFVKNGGLRGGAIDALSIAGKASDYAQPRMVYDKTKGEYSFKKSPVAEYYPDRPFDIDKVDLPTQGAGSKYGSPYAETPKGPTSGVSGDFKFESFDLGKGYTSFSGKGGGAGDYRNYGYGGKGGGEGGGGQKPEDYGYGGRGAGSGEGSGYTAKLYDYGSFTKKVNYLGENIGEYGGRSVEVTDESLSDLNRSLADATSAPADTSSSTSFFDAGGGSATGGGSTIDVGLDGGSQVQQIIRDQFKGLPTQASENAGRNFAHASQKQFEIPGLSRNARERFDLYDEIIGMGRSKSKSKGAQLGAERHDFTQQLIGNMRFENESQLNRAKRKNARQDLIEDYGFTQLLTPTEVSNRFIQSQMVKGDSRDTQATFSSSQLMPVFKTGFEELEQVGKSKSESLRPPYVDLGIYERANSRERGRGREDDTLKSLMGLRDWSRLGDYTITGEDVDLGIRQGQKTFQGQQQGQQFQFKYDFDFGQGYRTPEKTVNIPDKTWEIKIPRLNFDFGGGARLVGGEKYARRKNREFKVRDVLEVTLGESQAKWLPGFNADDWSMDVNL